MKLLKVQVGKINYVIRPLSRPFPQQHEGGKLNPPWWQLKTRKYPEEWKQCTPTEEDVMRERLKKELHITFRPLPSPARLAPPPLSAPSLFSRSCRCFEIVFLCSSRQPDRARPCWEASIKTEAGSTYTVRYIQGAGLLLNSEERSRSRFF